MQCCKDVVNEVCSGKHTNDEQDPDRANWMCVCLFDVEDLLTLVTGWKADEANLIDRRGCGGRICHGLIS